MVEKERNKIKREDSEDTEGPFPSLTVYFFFPSLSPALFPISSHNQKAKDLERPQEQYVYGHFPMDDCPSAQHSARILSCYKII